MSESVRPIPRILLTAAILAGTTAAPFGAVESRGEPSNPSKPEPAAALIRIEIVDSGLPAEPKWPASPGIVTESYEETAFGFFHAPWRYTATGVRADRGNPYLFRATANVSLPSGKLRLLLRSRSASRLTIDGVRVAELPFSKPMGDGHNPLRKPVLHLGETRFVAPGDREKVFDYESSGGDRHVVLEAIVGGMDGKRNLRPELGELIVAWTFAGSDDFTLVSPRREVRLTDAGWNAYASERRVHYDLVEADRRAQARRRYAAEIATRHDAARQWAKARPVDVPTDTLQIAAGAHGNEIDRFLAARLSAAQAAAKVEVGDVRFHRDVKPLFAAKCYSCHSHKPRGGLRLDSSEAAQRGGDSGLPAISPKRPERSEILARVRSTDDADRMPPKGERLTNDEISLLERWIRDGASWPSEEPAENAVVAPSAENLAFLRRLFLDVVGVPPTLDDIRAYQTDSRPDRRARLIERLLDDPRWADVWTPRWQDWLGENPNLVNATLNNTGPFRYWLYESFLDNKPMDLFVRELVMMEGSVYGGGPAGFGLAAQNDAPHAAKAGVIASAFLGIEMKCARCHDAPFHESTQSDLFELAGLLARQPLKVPGTSTVALKPGEGRVPLIQVTLKPGEPVEPGWPFDSLLSDAATSATPPDSRARLADLLTSPQNERFAQVMVNRLWSHYFGRGLVEPLNDWEQTRPSHPELLTWLAREFVSRGYDTKHIARLILNSAAYQRVTGSDPTANRLYMAKPRRRLSAEQAVDSLIAAYGVPLDVGDVCIDLDGGRPPENGLNLGRPRRAWEFAYTSNDRDRPSLNLPRVRAVTEVLGAFGWPEIRQEAISDRKAAADVTQAALLQNGVLSRWLTRLSDDSELTDLALAANSPESLVRDVFLRILTREPTAAELSDGIALLAPGFDDRAVAVAETPRRPRIHEPYVAWSNHLDPESTFQRQKEESDARRGPAPTMKLDRDWRERCEDLLWSLLNAPEIVYSP